MKPENEIEAEKPTQTTAFLPSGAAPCYASSDTPETDAAEWGITPHDMIVRSELARKLERERDRYKAALVQIQKDGNRPMSMRISSPSIIASDALHSQHNAEPSHR